MKVKRRRLRLRKQVIYSIPIALFIAILTIALISNRNKMASTKVENGNNLEEAREVNDIVLQKDFEYLNFINEYIDERQMDNTIIYYALKFQLNPDVALQLAKKYTDNYQSDSFKQTYVIGPEEVLEDTNQFSNFEAGVVHFIRNLYRYPKRYGTSEEEIGKVYDVVRGSTNNNGTILMDNGMTFEQYMGKICDLYNLDKNVILAITYLETGYMSSSLFVNSNNIGGQRDSSGWLRFPTLEAGVMAHVLTLKSMFEKYGIDVNSPNGILDLSSIYVNGHVGNPAPSWAEKVTILRNQINEKNLFLAE